MNIKGLIGAMVLTMVTMAVVYRVEPVRKIVLGA